MKNSDRWFIFGVFLLRMSPSRKIGLAFPDANHGAGILTYISGSYISGVNVYIYIFFFQHHGSPLGFVGVVAIDDFFSSMFRIPTLYFLCLDRSGFVWDKVAPNPFVTHHVSPIEAASWYVQTNPHILTYIQTTWII